ncbi:hypothetical protein SSP24_56000 [Streptomyces spinoverrucosus]|uniref:Uncharacterized protein n=1 Tax=Streptomyces spinoverrucosus TaxID=284043 RepID=A0A4Y3VPK1_9ACTN|nr:hypothetical protein SSP24_56000 [Streptomyces spinoverrucosus]GHB85844.1 hypothetical protein GCM10010397_66540 [Streptomyces spinoverrucosus]
MPDDPVINDSDEGHRRQCSLRNAKCLHEPGNPIAVTEGARMNLAHISVIVSGLLPDHQPGTSGSDPGACRRIV